MTILEKGLFTRNYYCGSPLVYCYCIVYPSPGSLFEPHATIQKRGRPAALMRTGNVQRKSFRFFFIYSMMCARYCWPSSAVVTDVLLLLLLLLWLFNRNQLDMYIPSAGASACQCVTIISRRWKKKRNKLGRSSTKRRRASHEICK